MKKVTLGFSVIVLTTSIFISCTKENKPSYTIVSGTGNIAAKVDEFRQLLGSQLNTSTGVTGGRREVNWDGIPDQLLATPLPSNFFNTVDPGTPASRQRGLVYSTVGGTFEVSKNNFSEVNASASNQFSPFSGQQTFSNISSNLWDVGFEVAG